MLIKIGGLEIRTGKDAKPQASTQPQLEYQSSGVKPGSDISTVLAEPPRSQSQPATGLALFQGNKPHPMTQAIEWPEIPEDPLAQTRLSLLVNETDERFRKFQSVDICSIRHYLQVEGVTLYGKAQEAFDLLQELHCRKFAHIHPNVVQALPAMYTEIFRAMRGEYNISESWRF
jgi:hypothetical protein